VTVREAFKRKRETEEKENSKMQKITAYFKV
jgi:hypothetical protein